MAVNQRKASRTSVVDTVINYGLLIAVFLALGLLALSTIPKPASRQLLEISVSQPRIAVLFTAGMIGLQSEAGPSSVTVTGSQMVEYRPDFIDPYQYNLEADGLVTTSPQIIATSNSIVVEVWLKPGATEDSKQQQVVVSGGRGFALTGDLATELLPNCPAAEIPEKPLLNPEIALTGTARWSDEYGDVECETSAGSFIPIGYIVSYIYFQQSIVRSTEKLDWALDSIIRPEGTIDVSDRIPYPQHDQVVNVTISGYPEMLPTDLWKRGRIQTLAALPVWTHGDTQAALWPFQGVIQFRGRQ